MASRRSFLCLEWAGCVILGVTCLLVLSATQACTRTNQAAPEMVLTIIDQSWLDKPSQALLGEELNQFTQETGIRVQVLPAPEVARRSTGNMAQPAGKRKLRSRTFMASTLSGRGSWPRISSISKPTCLSRKSQRNSRNSSGTIPSTAGLWLCLTTSVKACFFIGSICCTSMDTLCRRKHGTSLRRWRSGFRLVSALRGIRIFGAMSGRVRLLRL